MKAVENYYSIRKTALLAGVCAKTIRRRLEAGEFGPDVVNLGGDGKGADYRIAASAINSWLTKRGAFSEPGIFARSVNELRRTAAATGQTS